MAMKYTDAEHRAMAFRIVDEIETEANKLRAKNPRLTMKAAMDRALAEMAK